jgi:(2R)-sulfolactate sulfo-lyase subunit alpha
MTNKGILLHEASDDVGVAAMDLKAGEEVEAVTLEGKFVTQVKPVEDIPLGHKIAMHALPAEKHVIEYGRPIGYAVAPIALGEHVHVHNIKSLRWAASKSRIFKE